MRKSTKKDFKMSSIFKKIPLPRFAPLSVPFERRKQTLWAGFIMTFLLVLMSVMPVLLYFKMYSICTMYLVYMYFDRSDENGKGAVEWMRHHYMPKRVGEYFPGKMVREAELDPNGKYLFGYHPHGVFAFGVSLGFSSQGLGFSKLFPGIQVHPLTLKVLFLVPFFRDYIIAMGYCVASKKSINNIFRQGKSCLLVVGGAEEMLRTRKNSADLFIKNRLGFVRMAIINGASLVPVYCFGENELYDTNTPEKGSLLHKIQQFFKRWTGMTCPTYSGRTFFTYNYGFLPHRHPLTVVVGAPIHTEMDPNPPEEMVKKVHQQYLIALKDLYDRNKEAYTHGSVIPEMNFI